MFISLILTLLVVHFASAMSDNDVFSVKSLLNEQQMHSGSLENGERDYTYLEKRVYRKRDPDIGFDLMLNLYFQYFKVLKENQLNPLQRKLILEHFLRLKSEIIKQLNGNNEMEKKFKSKLSAMLNKLGELEEDGKNGQNNDLQLFKWGRK